MGEGVWVGVPFWFLLACRAPVEPPPPEPALPLVVEDALRDARALAPPGFTVRYTEPWIVAGDEPEAVVEERTKLIRWATDALRAEYGFSDPDSVWTIWLFRDEASYLYWADALFEDAPTTPYGYASSDHTALVMNISTGGGTLVHEMVHPMLFASFPTVPAWFNEGLASLYEHVGEEEGRIHGYVNWRLPAVQESIAMGALPDLHWLMGLDHQRFYTADPGTNYGQARLVLYYLQQRGLLQAYYRAIRADSGEPVGAAALAEVLGRTDLVGFQEEWEAYVRGLE